MTLAEHETHLLIDYAERRVTFSTTKRRTRDSLMRRLAPAVEAGQVDEQVAHADDRPVEWRITLPKKLLRPPKMAFYAGDALRRRVRDSA